MAEKNTIWLASYPKSGNTWFRVFLTNLMGNTTQPASINDLLPSTIASSRQMFDEATGVASSDLSKEEIELLRPSVYRYVATHSDSLLFHKIHDAFTYTAKQEPLIPLEISRCAIYFIRNPLDLAISFANHLGKSVDFTIKKMHDPGYSFCSKTDRLHNQLEQKLLTWHDHVNSWTTQNFIPVCILRYEDMKSNTFETFQRAIQFCGLDYNEEEIRRAIRFSDIKELKHQEKELGFREKSPVSQSFFWKGDTGYWKETLTDDQVKEIINNHQQIMKKYGYLDDNLNPVQE